MCQPLGTYVTTVCRLPHAKAITGQIMLYLKNFNKAAKCVQNRGPVLGGVMPSRDGCLHAEQGSRAFAFEKALFGPDLSNAHCQPTNMALGKSLTFAAWSVSEPWAPS
jgi:hypothetical protein